jgi:hypothetical protein
VEFKTNSRSYELHIIIENKIIILDRTMSKEAMLEKLKATDYSVALRAGRKHASSQMVLQI